MSDEPDQRTELDDFLVVLRKLQRPTPDAETVTRAEAGSEQIRTMIRNGSAADPHRRIGAQIDERLAQLRTATKSG